MPELAKNPIKGRTLGVGVTNRVGGVQSSWGCGVEARGVRHLGSEVPALGFWGQGSAVAPEKFRAHYQGRLF